MERMREGEGGDGEDEGGRERGWTGLGSMGCPNT